MLEKFVENIESFKKENKALNVLVAVSGGVDSTVLAHLCHKAGINFSIAHCNFKLRSTESDEDQRFVEQLADDLGVSLFVQSFDTLKVSQDKSLSIQLTARELRYDWFEELVKNNNFDYLFAAHHLNDRVETTLFNFLRGGGIAGLRSIQKINNYIARPLLNFTRQDIELYAVVHNIIWREDSSNASKKYTRNYIRHEIIPHFADVHEHWEKSVNNTYKRLEQAEQILKNQAQEIIQKLYFYDSISKGEFLALVQEPVLLEISLKELGFRFDQCEYFIQELKLNKTHIEIIGENYKLISNRGEIELLKLVDPEQLDMYLEKPGDEVANSKLCIATSIIRRDVFQFDKDQQNAYFDLALIKFPITISSWKKGDTFVPFGMKGKKKLSDFFIDAKIPRHLKYEIPILRDAKGEILWIAGYRQSNKYIINSETQDVLIFHLI